MTVPQDNHCTHGNPPLFFSLGDNHARGMHEIVATFCCGKNYGDNRAFGSGLNKTSRNHPSLASCDGLPLIRQPARAIIKFNVAVGEPRSNATRFNPPSKNAISTEPSSAVLACDEWNVSGGSAGMVYLARAMA